MMKRPREYLSSVDSSSKVRTYLKKVKATLQNDNKYIMFCRVMIDFKDGFKADRVDYVGLATRVKEFLKWYDNLIIGFNDFLPKKHKIILDESVHEAVNFINKVHLRFYQKEHIYKAFLNVLSLCWQGHRSVHDVYGQVAALFKEHHDLVKEFERLISVEGFGVASCDDENVKASNKKYNQGLDLCGKEQNKLCNSDNYRNFLKCLHYYSTGVISKSDLQCLVADVLQNDSGLVDEFDSFLNCGENIDGLFPAGVVSDGYQSKSSKLECKSKEKRHVAKSIQELDLTQSEDCTPSYWLLLEEYQIPSAGQRSKLSAQVLNDRYVSRGKGSSSKPMHKDKHQEILFKCEDVRFELDMLFNSVISAAMQAEDLLKSIKENKITLKTPFDIKRHFTDFNLRCIKRLYGEQSLDVLDLLHRSPVVALPVMLTRLKQKQEELTRRQSDFNEFWTEVYAKFQQQNSKGLSIEYLERRINKIEERMQTEDDALLVTDAGNGKGHLLTTY